MIVIGSYAARLNGLELRKTIQDLDLVGTEDDVERFRTDNRAAIRGEARVHGHRHRFTVAPEYGFEKVEIDFSRRQSNSMLADLCTGAARVMNSRLRYPPIEVLYLIKRAHANRPTTFDKTIADLLVMTPRIGQFDPAQLAFGTVRRKEAQSSYKHRRERYALAISEAELAAGPIAGPRYDAEDLHRAIAGEAGAALHARCRQDLPTAGLDPAAFRALEPAEQLQLARAFFMVTGIEWYHLRDPAMPAHEVYRRGMRKALRDLLTGFVQDFGIDHAAALAAPPPFDFIARFEGSRAGLREIAPVRPSPGAVHRRVAELIERGELGQARRFAEDLARRSGTAGDPHAFYLLGMVFLAQQIDPLAEKCLRKCLLHDGANGQAWLRLGLLRQQAQDHRGAIACLDRAIALKLDGFAVHAHLGRSLEAEGRLADAAACYVRALAHDPQAAQVRRRLAALTMPGPTSRIAPAE